MFKRLVAISFILIFASVAWKYLSFAMDERTGESSRNLTDAVGGLWGTPHIQYAPRARLDWEETVKMKIPGKGTKKLKVPKTEEIQLDGSDISIDLNLEQRQKGLLWFSTYTSDFYGSYVIRNPHKFKTKATVNFIFPSQRAVYDKVVVKAEGRDDLQYKTDGNSLSTEFTMEPESEQVVEFGYSSKGLDQWVYSFGEEGGMVKNFRLAMTTNFQAIDFPRDSLSPDVKESAKGGGGWKLVWDKESAMVSNFYIGMVMPRHINPGPLASAMSSHAPVSLLFFFFMLFIFQAVRNLKMHPMNYFFIACGFFAFNLLFAYLVDHFSLKASFVASSAVSILLVVSYMRLVVGAKFALLEAGLSQFLFQVLFAFAHFFEGYTGLAITIGAIISLAAAMQLTGRIDWEERFREGAAGSGLFGNKTA